MKGIIILFSILTAASWTEASSKRTHVESVLIIHGQVESSPKLVKRFGGGPGKQPAIPRRGSSTRLTGGPPQHQSTGQISSSRLEAALARHPGPDLPWWDTGNTRPRTQSESGSSGFQSGIIRTPSQTSILNTSSSFQSARGRSGSAPSQDIQRTGSFSSFRSAQGRPESPSKIQRSASIGSASGRPDSPAASQKTTSSLASAVGRPDSPESIRRSGSFGSASDNRTRFILPPSIKTGISSPQTGGPPSPINPSVSGAERTTSPTGLLRLSARGNSPQATSRSQSELSFGPFTAASKTSQSARSSGSQSSGHGSIARPKSEGSDKSTSVISLNPGSGLPSRAISPDLARANQQESSRGNTRRQPATISEARLWGNVVGSTGSNSPSGSEAGRITLYPKSPSISRSPSFAGSNASDAPMFSDEDHRRHGYGRTLFGTHSSATSEPSSPVRPGAGSVLRSGSQPPMQSGASSPSGPGAPVHSQPGSSSAGGKQSLKFPELAQSARASSGADQTRTQAPAKRPVPDFLYKGNGLTSSGPPGTNFDPEAKSWNGGVKVGSANVRASVTNVAANRASLSSQPAMPPKQEPQSAPAKQLPAIPLSNWFFPPNDSPSRMSSPPRSPNTSTSGTPSAPLTPPQATDRRSGTPRRVRFDSAPPPQQVHGSPSVQAGGDGAVSDGKAIPKKGTPPQLPVSTPARSSSRSSTPATSPEKSRPVSPPQTDRYTQPSIIIHGRHGDTLHVPIPNGQAAHVRVPNPIGSQKDVKGKITYEHLTDSAQPAAPMSTPDKTPAPAKIPTVHPGAFAANCMYLVGGCLAVANGAYDAAAGRSGAGYQMAAGGVTAFGGGVGMMGAVGLDRALVDGAKELGGAVKNCVGAACVAVRNRSGSGRPPPSQQDPSTSRPGYAASVAELPVRRR